MGKTKAFLKEMSMEYNFYGWHWPLVVLSAVSVGWWVTRLPIFLALVLMNYVAQMIFVYRHSLAPIYSLKASIPKIGRAVVLVLLPWKGVRYLLAFSETAMLLVCIFYWIRDAKEGS